MPEFELVFSANFAQVLDISQKKKKQKSEQYDKLSSDLPIKRQFRKFKFIKLTKIQNILHV